MRYLACTIVVLLLSSSLFAQGVKYDRSAIKSSVAPVKVNVRNIQQVWAPQILNIEAPVPGGNSYRDFLEEIKSQIQPNGNGVTRKTSPKRTTEVPELGYAFEANETSGSPSDNDVAISNEGMLISVTNSYIYMYDTEADTFITQIGLLDFSAPLGITPHMYDPKVAYDPKADKFIMVWLSGSDSDSSRIVLAFSETKDPTGDWNLYTLPGNELDGQTWTDYPMIALTDNELILTGNALIDDTINTSDSWKYLFKESIVWQVGKLQGYTGQPLSYRYYSGIYHNNRAIRNLCPVKGGATTRGPGFYLLSNRNFDLTNDTIFIVHIDGLHDDPSTTLQVTLGFTDVPYGVPPNAIQPTLNNFGSMYNMHTNDARILGAFEEDGAIHFVQNTVLTDSARAAVMHGVINLYDNSDGIVAHIIGDYDKHFAYPNITYTGRYEYDTEMLITFLHTSEDTFPGISAVWYDSNEGYSDVTIVKQGSNYMRRTGSGTTVRWGDYTGSHNRYNNPGEVWISGCYGESSSSFSNPNPYRTWVAAVYSPDTVSENLTSVAELNNELGSIKTYPQPVADRFVTEFDMVQQERVTISLVDMNGKVVKAFLRETLSAGKKQFSFSMGPLEAGMYFLVVQGEGSTLYTEKVIKQ